jgi:Cu/Ag efflux pump CusA
MALSSSAGAEVQIATVVIGGLLQLQYLWLYYVLFKVLMEKNLKDLSLEKIK